MIDPYEYSITIKKVLIDDESVFEATVLEIPDIVEYGQTYTEAYELAIDTLTAAAAMWADSNRSFPVPYAHQRMSYA